MRKAFKDLGRTRSYTVRRQCGVNRNDIQDVPEPHMEADNGEERPPRNDLEEWDDGSTAEDDIAVNIEGDDGDCTVRAEDTSDGINESLEGAGGHIFQQNVADHGDESSEDREEEEEEEEDEEDNEDCFHFNARVGNLPLYTGAALSIMQSMCLILGVILKHNLSAACLSDVLELINLHCPAQNLFKHSLYRFKKFYSVTNAPFNKVYFCSNCFTKLTSAVAACNACTSRRAPSYFVQLPLIPQLKEIFKRPRFTNLLRSRFTRRKCCEECLEDIYDGNMYKEHVASGSLSRVNQLSFLWNSDGVPVFSSSQYSAWPFFLAINELPFKLRFLRENVLLGGLWFGKTQPQANLFLQSFGEDFRKLSDGVDMFVQDLDERVCIQAFVLGGTCDLPAKAKFLNVTQFNGDYGCPICETKGETYELGPRSRTHIYRYAERFTKRTLDSMIFRAGQAFEIGDAVKGVKGPTFLRFIMPDFIRGMGIDLMHLAVGVVRKLMVLQFGQSFSNSPFSLRTVLPLVDERLKSLKPPKFVHRMPRSVADLCHWKASEIKLWLFYYSPVVLNGIMRPDYYRHYMKLVIALSYLASTHVTPSTIDKADQLLHSFVKDFQVMYGDRHCSISFHLLLHLPDCVRDLGPLWAYTCFPFENLNGLFLKNIHGTRYVDTQVCNMFWKILKAARNFCELPEGAIRDFCLSSRKQSRILERIDVGCYSIGMYYNPGEDLQMIKEVLEVSDFPYGKILKFCRLLKCGSLYVSEGYQRNIQTRSSFCSYDMGEEELAGNILFFVKILPNCHCVNENECDCEGVFCAIIREVVRETVFTIPAIQCSLYHLAKCRMGNRVSAIPVDSLSSVCFYMYVDNQSYIAEPVNCMEVE